MSEKVSIAERIERELLRRVSVALADFVAQEVLAERMNESDALAASASVWDADDDGHRLPGLFSPVLMPVDDEDASAGGTGGSGGGLTSQVQAFLWQVRWQKRRTAGNESQRAMATHRRWVAWLESVVVVEDQLAEGGPGSGGPGSGGPGSGDPLVVEVEKLGSALGELAEGGPAFVSLFEFAVYYDTYRGNPWAGPGVGVLEE